MSTAGYIYNQNMDRYPGVRHRGYVQYSYEINQHMSKFMPFCCQIKLKFEVVYEYNCFCIFNNNIIMHKTLRLHMLLSVTFAEKPYTYLTYRIDSYFCELTIGRLWS